MTMQAKPFGRSSTAAALVFLGMLVQPVTLHAELPAPIADLLVSAQKEGKADELASLIAILKREYPDDINQIDRLAALTPQSETAVAQATASSSGVEDGKDDDAQSDGEAGKAVKGEVKVAAAEPDSKWDGKINLNGFYTSGNSDSLGASVAAELIREKGRWKHKWFGRFEYQELASRLSREYAKAGYQADWKISPHRYAYLRGEYEHDRFSGLDNRGVGSIGYGWIVLPEKPLRLALEAGPAMRYSDYAMRDDETVLTFRSTADLDWNINSAVKLSQDVEILAATKNSSLRSITGLEAQLTGRLSSRLSYDVRHLTEPQPGRAATDTVAGMGLVYDF